MFKVRNLKSAKADEASVKAEVKALLSLKTSFKELTGKDWSPEIASKLTEEPAKPCEIPVSPSSSNENTLIEQIAAQGEKVRDLKTKKADKSVIDSEVKTLLSLKADYKNLTGKDWKPGATPSKPSCNNTSDELLNKISQQGDKVRQLKTGKYKRNTNYIKIPIVVLFMKLYNTF